MHLSKKPVQVANAPAPVGPYSVAISTGHFLFCSGQIGLDPQSGKIVSGGVETEARQAMNNLKAVIESAGVKMDSIVKTTIFLKSMADFPSVNEIYASYFTGTPPARSTVAVAELPKGALVEVEAIAIENS